MSKCECESLYDDLVSEVEFTDDWGQPQSEVLCLTSNDKPVGVIVLPVEKDFPGDDDDTSGT